MPIDVHEVIAYMDEVVSRAVPGRRPPASAGSDSPLIVRHLDLADKHKDAGAVLAGPTRFRRLKGMFLRLARLHTTEQATYNHAVLAALHALARDVEAAPVDIDQRLGRVQAMLATAEVAHQGLVDDVHSLRQEASDDARALREQVTMLEESLVDIRRDRAVLQTELAVQRARVEMLLREARSRLPELLDQDQLQRMAEQADELMPLYAQLEEAFRGSRTEIVELQKKYLPDVSVLDTGSVLLDIGCGRGEWLELLRDNGITAYGVDTNPTFVASNVERGLDVRLDDGIEHLESLEEGTLGAVTGFHLVEHLPFEHVVRLVDAALRALRPGGCLIFETPNPTNVVVGSASFYIDPTHRNPVHPQFIEFLLTARGYVDVELRYLHPAAGPPFTLDDDAQLPFLRRLIDHLNWAFFGPQDYAVVARKAKPVA